MLPSDPVNKTVFSLIAVCATPAVLLSLACTLGFDPPLAELRAGTSEMPLAYAASTQLPIEWRVLRALDPPKATPFLFFHLQDEDGRLVRTFDRPVHGMPEGGDAIEIWQSLLTEPLPAGRYRLVAGLYDAATGRRWRLETNGADLGRGKYRLATVEVASTRRTTPDLVFGGEDNCVITLEPSFTTVGPEGKRRSIGLETAFFRLSIHAD